MPPEDLARPLAPNTHRFSPHLPVLALLLATVFWGMGFTWAKAAGESLNAHAKLPPGAAMGPVLLLAARFGVGALVWFACFPSSRRGWTARSMGRGALLGFILAIGLISQHLGLDRTSETVSAFLTNLTVIFVPLLVACISRRWPHRRLAAAILMAAIGIYLMTGAAPQGFGYGEALGLACSLLFSIYIVGLDRGSVGEDPVRLTGIQFLVVGAICLAASAGLARGRPLGFRFFWEDRAILIEALLLILLTTVGAFGLMMRFQPSIDPTRAALIYLAEPVVAAIWAWLIAGRSISLLAAVGATLIVVANFLARREGEREVDR